MAGGTSATAGKRQQRHFCSSFALWMLLLPLLAAAATAAPTSTSTSAERRRCPHKGIAELIRTSPVIVKALAARIFTDAELEAGEAGGGTGDATATLQSATILITLTPETIYKGASLLKMANGPGASDNTLGSDSISGSAGRRNSYASVNGGSSWSGSGAAESTYQYEGQLNATLQPPQCFDANMLKMLPTELIAFGKLLPASAAAVVASASGFASGGAAAAANGATRQLQQSLLGATTLGSDADAAADKDILHISINGLHRWTPQFENHIWKHLGWDDWSDFTLCSVTCGKGVQQRFRRCLLDNPLVDINMNMNLNLEDDDDEDDDGVDDDFEEKQEDEMVADEANNDASATAAATATAEAEAAAFNTDNNEVFQDEIGDESEAGDAPLLMMQPADVLLHKLTQTTATATTATATATGLTSGDNEAAKTTTTTPGTGVSFVAAARNDHRRTRANNQHKKRKNKKRKAAKSLALSTLLCEGYNIEQRNCNSFECNDDISDLLKFYKKLPASLTEDPPIVANNNDTMLPITMGSPLEFADLTTAGSMGMPSSSTPSNMGYIRSWRNMLNFTLMITLRAKNDTKNTSTIFSIRNITHNLYLEACKDGLRLYLERDNTTEMLPVKFNLYDYRWHQVAISIQNGDFISIYVDCSWTNSFVVSKRLFTLPLDADVEIGRGFNGELQQLLVLPEHQERLQCSNKRTSINEVKRYIIDTFIEDYANN